MKNLYLAIIAYLQALPLDPKFGANLFFADIWNDQVSKIDAKDAEGNTLYAIQLPAIFIEIDGESKQLGNGYQIFDDLVVKLHLVHQQLDAGDGAMDRNVDVIDLQDIVYQAMNKWQTTGTNEFIRKHPAQNFSHDNVYHFVIEYGTTFVDNLRAEPFKGVLIPGPNTIAPIITITD